MSDKPQRLAPIIEACAYGKFRKTKCYELLNAGKITAKKEGTRTMVDLDSIDSYYASLPGYEPRKKSA